METIASLQRELADLQKTKIRANVSTLRVDSTDEDSRHQLPPTSFQNPKDVGNIVWRWKLSFDGQSDQTVKNFLMLVTECADSAQLTDAELLTALSELFKGTAATRYRNNRDDWKTWQDFCHAARRSSDQGIMSTS